MSVVRSIFSPPKLPPVALPPPPVVPDPMPVRIPDPPPPPPPPVPAVVPPVPAVVPPVQAQPALAPDSTPVTEEAKGADSITLAARKQRRDLKSRQILASGRRSTILTSGTGLADVPAGLKTVLGQ